MKQPALAGVHCYAGAERIGRVLERDGLITRDCENTYLNFDRRKAPRSTICSGIRSCTALPLDLARGRRYSRYAVFAAQRDGDGRKGVAEYACFSIEPDAREKLELREPVGDRGGAVVADAAGVHVCLKTRIGCHDAHRLEPLDFMARLAALVPPPRVHQTRYHGVLAPGSALRAAVTPSGRGRGASKPRAEEGGAPEGAAAAVIVLTSRWADRRLFPPLSVTQASVDDRRA